MRRPLTTLPQECRGSEAATRGPGERTCENLRGLERTSGDSTGRRELARIALHGHGAAANRPKEFDSVRHGLSSSRPRAPVCDQQHANGRGRAWSAACPAVKQSRDDSTRLEPARAQPATFPLSPRTAPRGRHPCRFGADASGRAISSRAAFASSAPSHARARTRAAALALPRQRRVHRTHQRKKRRRASRLRGRQPAAFSRGRLARARVRRRSHDRTLGRDRCWTRAGSGRLSRVRGAGLPPESGVRDARGSIRSRSLARPSAAGDPPAGRRLAPRSVGPFGRVAARRNGGDTAALHPVYAARAFRRFYGCSPGQLVRRERLARAARSIRSTDEALADIADRCGFSDQSHLTRELKRALGQTTRPLRRLGRSSSQVSPVQDGGASD